MSRGMQTDLTSGAYHGRTRRLYVWGLSRSKHKRRNRLDLRATQPPAASAQARPAVGGSLRGDDAPLAAGRQKYRWPPMARHHLAESLPRQGEIGRAHV